MMLTVGVNGKWTLSFLVVVSCVLVQKCHSLVLLLLLSDIATPAFLIDVGFVRKKLGNVDIIPPLTLDDDDGSSRILTPIPLETTTTTWCPHKLANNKKDHGVPRTSSSCSSSTNPAAKKNVLQQRGVCYWHASVTRGRQEMPPPNDDDDAAAAATFLAALDLPLLPAANDSYLALGLNNHHVISYYWARSAGAGASMEAPGIALRKDGCLVWQNAKGPTACNSNDGKRSEWVNFLQPGDQVQLVPKDPVQALQAWLQTSGGGSSSSSGSRRLGSAAKIFGISSYQRPLGSEPAVVCEWKLESVLQQENFP